MPKEITNAPSYPAWIHVSTNESQKTPLAQTPSPTKSIRPQQDVLSGLSQLPMKSPLNTRDNPPYQKEIAVNIAAGIDAWINKNQASSSKERLRKAAKSLGQIREERVAWIQSRVMDAQEVIKELNNGLKPD
ncbi:hypothetical protein [Uliginosibacterium gangwonense]|uniref:hypothetical protein n=1 Tax=Uliginosibacterium gangwonense TaxID=392736 RepID=UPI0012FBB3E9|nr:hypothetical protein [Uliginosibacterium gangwonense]